MLNLQDIHGKMTHEESIEMFKILAIDLDIKEICDALKEVLPDDYDQDEIRMQFEKTE